MFEAGRRSLLAFSSNRIWPVSSEVTLIPTIADDKSGLARMAEMRERNSARLFVGSDFNEGVGDRCGLATGLGLGEGVVCAVAGGCSRRSRSAVDARVTGTVNKPCRIRISAIVGGGVRAFIFSQV